MRLFLLGATGSIGTALLPELLRAGHHVTALCRSEAADDTVTACGGSVLRADMRDCDRWVDALAEHDAVIHTAITFDDEMIAADRVVVDTLRAAARTRSMPLRVIYTGGCWLYGDTNGHLATEDAGFDPIPAFQAMLDHSQLLQDSALISTATLHPAMVYHAQGGVFDAMLGDIKADRPIEIWGSAKTRWPLIHRDDLAVAYRLLVEAPQLTGHFNAVAQSGVALADIASTLARAFGHDGRRICLPRDAVFAREGHWAEGPMLDQRLSGARLAQATGWSPQYRDLRQSFPPV